MNRRQFIKASIPAVTIPAIAITCKYEDDEKGPEKKSEKRNWPYRVYCYERKQGEFIFSQNIKGSFAYQREYMTLEEDTPSHYCGWMDNGILHFKTLDDAADFVECHARTKDDINLIDSIYDIYCIKRDEYYLGVGEEPHTLDTTEMKVAHYWFNGDTGRQIHWVAKEPYTDWSKIECS
tara:strand:+ start:236 stop:772 length:537 start_codon:yes stop_codon:yes gene_type:complete